MNAYRAEPRRVKGHGTVAMNDLVDRLAVAAAASHSGVSGTGAPDVLGPPDEAGPGAIHGRDPESRRRR